MFGFVSVVSPKALLAKSLARALSTFFDVDPTTVESNLLQDTRIILHYVKLKPLQVHRKMTLVGCVQEIEFAWIWGGDERTAIVRETRLTIRGARFRCILQQEQSDKEDKIIVEHNQEKALLSNEQQDLSYLQRIVQQVVDHLTLVITDVELTIQVSSSAKIVLEASELGLVSFGRTEESPLSQRISLGSFLAHIVDDKTETKVPLIDSVGYAASVKRVSGRRFVDGLVHGLEIVGEEKDENACVVLHAGRNQVQVLCQMMDLLLTDEKNSMTAVSFPDSQRDKLVKDGLLEDEVFEDAREALEEENSIRGNNAATPSLSPSTTFELPLPSLTIVLPNNSKVSMPNCIFQYTVDGSVFCIQGHEGIKINDNISLVTFRSKVNKTNWLVDFCTNEILLKKDQDDNIIGNVVWRDDEMKRLMRGFCEVVEATPVSVSERVEDALHVTPSPIENGESQPWSFVTEGFIHLRMQRNNEEWIEATIESPSIEISGSEVSNVSILSVTLGPTSFGEATIRIPKLYQSTEPHYYFIQEPISASFESAVVADNIQAFLAQVLTLDSLPTNHTPSNTQTRHPYQLCITSASMTVRQPAISIIVENVKTCDSKVHCQSIEYKDASGVFGRVGDITAKLTAPIEVTTARIESLHIPGIASLPEPVSGMSLLYTNGLLRIIISSLNLITPLICKSLSSKPSKANDGQDEFTLPFPVNLHLDELVLWSTSMDCSVCINPVDIAVVSADDVSINASGPMTIQLASSSSDDCLKMIVGSSSAVLCPSKQGYTVGSCRCSGIQVEPTSSIHMSVNIPVVSMSTNEPITVGGSVNVSVQSFGVLEYVQRLFSRFFPSDASSDHTPLLLPEAKLSITDIHTQLSADSVKVKDNEVSCERLVANESTGMSASLSGILGTFGPEVTFGIEWIETLYVPSVCTLQKPVRCTTAAFVGEDLCVNIGTVYALSLVTSKESTTVQQTQDARTDSAMVVPFPIRVNLKELTVDFPISKGEESTLLRKIELDIKPADIDPFSLERSPRGSSLYAAIDQVENKMMKLEMVCTSGTVYNGDSNVVHRFAFAAKNAVVVAGFSSLDWSNMFGDEKEKVPVMLPFASMEPFKAHLLLQGNVVATHMDVNVPLFQGDANSNSDDLIRHLTTSILSKAPSIITNSEFLGENVVEMSTKTGGRALMASTVAGSAVGSVGGLVAVDSIRGAIASGKKSRNASMEDRYHFGDISRGTVRSVAQAAKTGGQVRRGSSESYRVGDFTVGASRSACEYASENKSRLSAATGSGVGMAVAAALGPVGLVGMVGVVAGGYIGSKIGGSICEDDKKHSLNSSESQREYDYATTQRSTLTPTAPIGGDEDLLGLNTLTTVEGQNHSSTMARPGSMEKSTVSATFVTRSEEADLLTNSPVRPNRVPPAGMGAPTAETRPQPPNRMATSRVPHQSSQSAQPHNEGYRFGDLTKSVVARGKKKDGRSESEGYKFGDFTRGLFG